MSDTNPFRSQELATDLPRANGDDTAKILDPSGHALSERLGVGGMGEVYRCGDEALQRDLAIKILKEELRGNADAEERFLREARLTDSLQHPGVVPIHNLSRLADGRPCYTMKLVRGRTFADMLRDEAQGPERLPRLLAILEKVCQAVAYAHSKYVIHRDLKPSNIMVGEFGEVQVMDWGLAKELSRNEPSPPPEATEEVETAAWTKEAEGLSRAGSALGTPAYMPPEQAAGDWDIVDERADVFSLGAILCEMLTGHPPYHGSNRDDLLRRARRGDLAEALSRLEKCGADVALVDLCRECLAAERLQRPRHAGVVAERLASYQAEVRDRLRQADLQRARAEVKALEERKRRRLLAVMAWAALMLIAGGAAAGWQWQQRRAKADGAVELAVGEARSLLKEARSNVLTAAGYDKAIAAAHNALEIARAGGASESMQQQAKELIDEVDQEKEEAAKDRRLLAALLEVHGPHEGPKYRPVEKDTMTAMAEPTTEEQFAAAFRDWGLAVDATPPAEAAKLLKKRPAAVVMEVSAALDEWASQRRQDRKLEAKWPLVVELAAALDDDPSSLRRELRDIMARGQLPVERALGMLSAALRPEPVPVVMPLGEDRRRLRRLAEKIDAAFEPVLGLLTLTRALRAVGDDALAERLLRSALTARPLEVVLYHTLGQLLTEQEPPRWAEAVEFYRAARGLRPDLGVNLATALLRIGRDEEGLALLARLVNKTPTNPFLRHHLGWALHTKGQSDEALAEYRQAIAREPKNARLHNDFGVILCDDKHDYDGAITCFRQAIALDPKYATPHRNLGVALSHKGRLDEAVASYRQAIALDPKYAAAHGNLGFVLHTTGRLDEAVASYRQAIALDPKNAAGHSSLGLALHTTGRSDEAVAAYRQAIALKPDYADAYISLGAILNDAQGKHVEAEAAFRKAIALKPDDASAYHNLGVALRDQGKSVEAEAAFRKAIAIKPDSALAYLNLGTALRRQGKFKESLAAYRSGHELGSKQPGWRYPSGKWLRDSESLTVLAEKLPAILTGEATPANPGEAVVLASMCQQPYQNRYAASVRLYTDAFTAEPKLAAGNRYNAACSAALAAAGKGEDARLLPDKVAAMFRRWALQWLRDDLTAYAKLAERNNPAANKAIQQRLARWHSDPDLASVRDQQMLEHLPDGERAAWQALWRDVDELMKRAAKTDGTKAAQKKAKP